MVWVLKAISLISVTFQGVREVVQKQQQIIWDFVGLILAKFVGQGAELITISLIAHHYGLKDYSVLTFVLSLTVMMRVVGNFGLDKWVVREIAVHEKERGETISNIFVLLLLWLSGFYVLYALGIYFFVPAQKLLFLAAGLYQFLYVILLVIYGVAAGHERFELEQKTSVVIGSVLVTMTLILYWKDVQIELMILAYLIAVFAGILFAVFYRFEIFGDSLCSKLIRREKVRSIVKSTFNFGLTDICNNLQIFMIYLMIDHLLIDQSNVGLFNAAFRVIIAILFIFQLFMKRMYPVMAKMREFHQSFQRNTVFILSIGLVFHGLAMILAPWLITMIFGAEFFPAIRLLRLGSMAAPVILLNEYFGTLCAAGKREVQMKRISFIGILMLTIAGACWIPRYSVEGAMWAYLISEGIKLVLYYLELSGSCYSKDQMMEV